MPTPGPTPTLTADDARRLDPVPAVVLLAVGLVLLPVGGGVIRGADAEVGTWWHVIPLVLGCAAVLVRRLAPVGALAAGTIVFAGDVAIGGSLGLVLVLWELLYSAGLHAGPRARTVIGALAVVGTLGGAVAATASEHADDPVRLLVLTTINIGAILLLPLLWASDVRSRTEVARLAESAAALAGARADDAERIASADRRAAVQAERAAMARDLHDVVAGHLSAIAIRTGAALSTPAPASAEDRGARDALALVRRDALTSLEEMRAMILLLRSDAPPDDLRSAGRLAELPTTVAWAGSAGLDVRLEDPDDVVGASARGALPAATDQAAHRILREALTNALKHAPGAVEVSLAMSDAGPDLRVEVTSPSGPVRTGAVQGRPVSGGTGLTIMRERAEALGGTFRAGPTPAGWAVHATLPVGAP